MTATSIRHMHYTERLNEWLEWDRQAAADRRAAFRAQWEQALDTLQQTDPQWEAWYDAQPEQTCGEMLPLMVERIEAFALAAEQQGANEAHTRTLLECWAAQDAEAELGTQAAVSGGEAAEF